MKDRKEPSYERGRNSTLYSRELRAGDSKHCYLYLLIFSVVPKALKVLRRRRRRKRRRRRRRKRRRKKKEEEEKKKEEEVKERGSPHWGLLILSIGILFSSISGGNLEYSLPWSYQRFFLYSPMKPSSTLCSAYVRELISVRC